jgi:putative transposase
MKDCKRGSHTVRDCKYHLVWTTKYRYQVLGGDIGHRCRELLREIAISKEMMIYAGSIHRDHVHLLLSIPPQLSVSRAVQYLKGKSSHRLLSEYKALRKRYLRKQATLTDVSAAILSVITSLNFIFEKATQLTAIDAFEGNKRVYSRKWNRRIKRNLV